MDGVSWANECEELDKKTLRKDSCGKCEMKTKKNLGRDSEE